MNKLILSIFVVYVSWTLEFRQYDSKKIKTENHSQVFLTRDEAMEFIEKSPQKGKWFECQDSLTGEYGYCAIKNIYIDRKKKPIKEEE